MRLFSSLLLSCALACALPAHAEKASPPVPVSVPVPVPVPVPVSVPVPQQTDESRLQSHQHYRNKAAEDVHGPAKTVDGKVPPGASARCSDGSYSFSRSRRGTCSRHGGVADWL